LPLQAKTQKNMGNWWARPKNQREFNCSCGYKAKPKQLDLLPLRDLIDQKTPKSVKSIVIHEAPKSRAKVQPLVQMICRKTPEFQAIWMVFTDVKGEKDSKWVDLTDDVKLDISNSKDVWKTQLKWMHGLTKMSRSDGRIPIDRDGYAIVDNENKMKSHHLYTDLSPDLDHMADELCGGKFPRLITLYRSEADIERILLLDAKLVLNEQKEVQIRVEYACPYVSMFDTQFNHSPLENGSCRVIQEHWSPDSLDFFRVFLDIWM
jgi:hypothetical protein